MEILYEGVDISGQVQARSCLVRDNCGDRCDSLEIEFENAERWSLWAPQEDDRILVAAEGYDSGVMYVNRVIPEEGRFRLLASALPCRARKKSYRSFTGRTLEEILRSCAAADGMEAQIYGLDGSTRIPYIAQENESSAAFLQKLLRLEGAALKCINGRYTAIGILWAQERSARETLRLRPEQGGYALNRSGEKLRALSVRTPYGAASAVDTEVDSQHAQIICNELPARSDIQAGRWARGLLLDHNRKCESLRLETDYRPGFTAMERLDIQGGMDAEGSWLIECVEHELTENKSRTLLRRCMTGIR